MKYSFYSILVFICLTLTSCFEIIEDVTQHQDGSGSYKFIVNLSQSKNQIDKIRTQDSILHFKVPQISDIDARLDEVKTKLLATNGISNVQLKKDHINYLYQLSCDYNNTGSLNNAISTIWKSYDKNAPAALDLYSFNDTVFKRSVNTAYINHLVKNAGSQEVDMYLHSNYTVICRFDTPIISNHSMNYTLSPSKKGAMYKNDVWSTLTDNSKSATIITVTP